MTFMELTAVTGESFSLFAIICWANNTSNDKIYLGDYQDGKQNNLRLEMNR